LRYEIREALTFSQRERGLSSSTINHQLLTTTFHSPPTSSLFYILSLFAFVLAMLSKGSVAVLPVIILGIIWWRRRLTWRDWLRTVPFFAVAVILTLVNIWFQSHGSPEPIRNAQFAERLAGAGGVIWFYLYKSFLPVELLFVYKQWTVEPGNLLWWLPLMFAVALTVVLWMYRNVWGRPFLFAWLFFCVALVPVLGLTDVYFMKFSLVADHYQHIALIGATTLVAAGWWKWKSNASTALRLVCYAAAGLAVVACMFLTWRQSGMYLDETMLYEATLKNNPDMWMLHNI
jgi:protein O-mannosyl-transferase